MSSRSASIAGLPGVAANFSFASSKQALMVDSAPGKDLKALVPAAEDDNFDDMGD